MKKTIIRICSMVLCFVMVFSLSSPTIAMANDKTESNYISEHVELEHATIFLEETENYRITYIAYDSDILEYAINRKDGSQTVDYGLLKLSSCSDKINIYNTADVIEFVMGLSPDGTYELNNSQSQTAVQAASAVPSITTTSQALTYARNYGPGYLPEKNQNIGSRTRNGVTALTTERIWFYANEDFYIDFNAGDFISVISSALPSVSLGTLLTLIPYAWDYLMRRYATEAGELYMFTVNNDRMKTARINNQTWYWAAWDYKFRVYSSSTTTKIEVYDNNKHYDYGENYIYFGDKALDNYFSAI